MLNWKDPRNGVISHVDSDGVHSWFSQYLDRLTNNRVINYLYDLPEVSGGFDNRLTRSILNNWHLSGFVTYLSSAPINVNIDGSANSSDKVTYSTTDSVNTTGGGDGARVVITGNPNRGPKKFGEYFDTSVFQRPSGLLNVL